MNVDGTMFDAPYYDEGVPADPGEWAPMIPVPIGMHTNKAVLDGKTYNEIPRSCRSMCPDCFKVCTGWSGHKERAPFTNHTCGEHTWYVDKGRVRHGPI